MKRVRAFNADAQLRICPNCGAVHPPIYGFHAEADTPEERAAREARLTRDGDDRSLCKTEDVQAGAILCKRMSGIGEIAVARLQRR